ncbi:MAG: glycosyltransferase family 39 protein [Acidaminococcaceae bacterium]|nr:glycosyltransferase family 39 protein [Acidaminococcaceae bacterium]
MSKKSWLIFWAAAIFLVFFLNSSLLITDSVESNYSLTAKEMVLSGNWISPQIYGRFWYDKPIFVYWMIALGFKFFGFTEFAARFFPALTGLLGLLLATWGGKKLYSEKVGFYSGVIILTTIQFFLISKSILTDGALFFFFNGTLLFFYLAYSGVNKKYYYGTYAFSALATLTKGPIGFLLPGLVIVLFLLWERNWKELRKAKLVSGTLLFLVLAGPWYITMIYLHQDFLGSFLGTHNFLRATVSEHPKDNVIYYYLLINMLAFFPWVGFLPGMLKNTLRKAHKWIAPAAREKFLLLWVFVIFFFYQNMATKYITYTYPIFLPLAYLVAAYFIEQKERLAFKGVLAYNLFFFGILTIAAQWIKSRNSDLVDNVQQIFILALCYFLIYFIGCFAIWKRGGNWLKTVTAIAIAGFCFNVIAAQVICQPLLRLRSAYFAALYLKEQVSEDTYIVSSGRYPTSAVFYSGRRIVKLIEANEVADYIPKAYSWSVKDVMPFSTYKKAEEIKNVAAIVYEDDVAEFIKNMPRHWQKHEFNDKWVVLTENRQG